MIDDPRLADLLDELLQLSTDAGRSLLDLP